MNVPTAAELAAALAKDPDGLNEFADLTSTTNATEEPAVPPSLIKCELTGHMATITLANDRRRNALSGQLLDELVSALEQLARVRARAVVLRAAPGAVVWSAGHDIRELPRDGADPITYHDPLERALRAIRKHPAPVIAMVHGSVWGGATDLALSCDFIVADQTAQFAITPVNLGLPYNASGIQNFIARVGAHIARQMFFTAEPIHAEQARECGIINYLVDSSQLQTHTNDLAERLARKAPLAIAVIKEQIRMLSEATRCRPPPSSASRGCAAGSTPPRTTRRESTRSWKNARRSSQAASRGTPPQPSTKPGPTRGQPVQASARRRAGHNRLFFGAAAAPPARQSAPGH